MFTKKLLFTCSEILFTLARKKSRISSPSDNHRDSTVSKESRMKSRSSQDIELEGGISSAADDLLRESSKPKGTGTGDGDGDVDARV